MIKINKNYLRHITSCDLASLQRGDVVYVDFAGEDVAAACQYAGVHHGRYRVDVGPAVRDDGSSEYRDYDAYGQAERIAQVAGSSLMVPALSADLMSDLLDAEEALRNYLPADGDRRLAPLFDLFTAAHAAVRRPND
jgi:hypothetical protein